MPHPCASDVSEDVGDEEDDVEEARVSLVVEEVEEGQHSGFCEQQSCFDLYPTFFQPASSHDSRQHAQHFAFVQDTSALSVHARMPQVQSAASLALVHAPPVVAVQLHGGVELHGRLRHASAPLATHVWLGPAAAAAVVVGVEAGATDLVVTAATPTPFEVGIHGFGVAQHWMMDEGGGGGQ